ncbi:MAG: hypothetical protein NWF07_08930 [Candidatus Bathyarchaeota archaeon]|nr:hypothetical protein [Candidatus Bathyarchaeota archaeon]
MQELTVKQVQDVILETQEDKNLRDMYIHKSPCAENSLGAVFFAISGTPPRGYAMYLPGEDMKAGTLHVFDNLGLKRKIMHCKITDLDSCKDNDVWSAQEAKPLVEA